MADIPSHNKHQAYPGRLQRLSNYLFRLKQFRFKMRTDIQLKNRTHANT